MLLQQLRTNQCHFVAKIGVTAAVRGREETLCKVLQPASVLRWDRIPSFRCTEMQIVDGIEIHIFGMPRKGGLPHSKVKIGRVYTIDLNPIIRIDIVENCTKLVDVPHILALIRQAATDVSTVNRSHICDVLPIFSLQVFVVEMLGCLIAICVGQITKLLNGKGLLLNVDLLVDTLLAGHHLTDWCRYRDINVFQISITLFPGNPFFRRNHLKNYASLVSVQIVIDSSQTYLCQSRLVGSLLLHVLNEFIEITKLLHRWRKHHDLWFPFGVRFRHICGNLTKIRQIYENLWPSSRTNFNELQRVCFV